MKRFLILFLALPALAQAAGLTAPLTWTAPTLNTDGSTIAGAQLPLKYNVLSGPNATTQSSLATGVSALTYTASGYLSNQTVCFTVVTVDATGAQSAPTNAACKTFPPPTPTPPPTLTVQ